MIDIARIEISTRIEKHVYDSSRAREMERSLAIPAPLVYARRIVRQDLLEKVGSVEMRGGTRVGNRTPSEQAIGDCIRCAVQGMKAARPPAAFEIRVSAKPEEHIDELHVSSTRHRHERRRIEGKSRLVDCGLQLRMRLEHVIQRCCIAVAYRFSELICRREPGLRHLLE
jgi:hypothetical protein